jgi:WsaF, C-terminal domain/WsaF, N-terminal domain/Glycosyl transferase family 2
VTHLHAELDSPLPDELAIGSGTALFVAGWCVCPAGRIRELSILLDGEPQPVSASGMPRLDVFRALHPSLDPFAPGVPIDPQSAEDPLLHGYRSGFWGMVRIAPEGGAARELMLRAELDGGGQSLALLGRVRVVDPVEPATIATPARAAGPLVAICMATHEPPADLVARQLESIRSQSHGNWVCLVSDDCSSPARFAALREQVGEDPRFVLSRSERRLGFYRNFERALALVPREAALVALSDQDDSWHPDKLATLLTELDRAQLVYSDARLVTRSGETISDTYWSHRRNNHSSLLSLLVANAVTGAASLFPRELLDDVLPFPPAQFAHFHDHWIGLVALARGDVAFVDRPLYDYVQHGGASLGHAAANRMTALRDRFAALRRDPRERVRMWRMHYFVDACRLLQMATVLDMRCGPRMSAAKRRALRSFLRTDRSWRSLAVLGARGARELVGTPETLGAEWMLFHAFAWRRLLGATARDRPMRHLRLDAVPPARFAQQPSAGSPIPEVRMVGEKIAPLPVAVADAPPRVNVLVPTIDLEHLFGGYIAKLNLARRLAERGARVRIVTVDPVGPLPRGWRRTVESYRGLTGLFDRVEVEFGREAAALEVSPSDRFIATTWWTAHIAHDALRALDANRFLYLIQEYEPFTFPMGTWSALACESYRFEHFALFSTELLRDYFRGRRLGVYARDHGDASSASFQNAITPVAPAAVSELAGRVPRRLLFYARPEAHAARNLFELGILALGRALADGAMRSGWELRGIGTTGRGRRLDLGAGATLELLPRAGQDAYAEILREHDLGLALMYTPHPSLVPIEMASAGMVTVTNTCENKTVEALASISPNLIAAEPTVAGVAEALVAAAAAVNDAERRVAGSAVRWSHAWDNSFDDGLLDRIAGFLQAA